MEKSKGNGEGMKGVVYSCTLEYKGDLHPSFISPMVYGKNGESPVDTYVPFEPDYTFSEKMADRESLFDKTGVEVSIPEDCSDIELSAGPITRHTENLNELLSHKSHNYWSSRELGQDIEVYRESFHPSVYPFDPLVIEMYKSLDSRSKRSTIRIILYSTDDLQENDAINAISDIISNVLCTRLEYMNEVETRALEDPVWKNMWKYRDHAVLLVIYREYIFILRGYNQIEFLGYFYGEGNTDIVLIHGLDWDDDYVALIPDMYNPDSHINQIINLLLRNAWLMYVPQSFRRDASEEDFWMSLLETNDGCPKYY